MSLRKPSQVSATTGNDQGWWSPLYFTFQAMMVSRTSPTLWVLVSAMGPSRNPDSSTQVVPVISPLPLRLNHPAYTGSVVFLPLGKITVTPVRTGPSPTFRGPSPRISVVVPTSTPATSVIALRRPGVPSHGTPRSRARSGDAAGAWPSRETAANEHQRMQRKRRQL